MSVWLEAARAVDVLCPCGCDRYRGCCEVLDIDDQLAFARVFRPDNQRSYWWGKTNARNRQPRVLALLFMHWMTR